MKKILFSFAAICIIAISQSFMTSGDCSGYFFGKLGAKFEIKNFDAKNKLLTWYDESIDSVVSLGNAVRIVTNCKVYVTRGKCLSDNNYATKCENGIFYFNMSTYQMAYQNPMQSTMKVKSICEGGDIEFPSTITPGQTLKDSKMVITTIVTGSPNPMINGNSKCTDEIYNRKAISDTTITTSAGTFNCIKISMDSKTDGGVLGGTTIMHFVECYAKNVGMVRTDTYNAKGKLIAYSLLSSITGN